MMPEDVAQVRERFKQLFADGAASKGGMDFDLFFQVGALLVQQGEPVTMGELSQTLEVPLSTATRIVDRLVANEYAQRLPDAEDRRIVRVALTETGQYTYRVIDEFFQTRLRQILSHFTPDEQGSLLALLNKLLDVIGAEMQNRSVN